MTKSKRLMELMMTVNRKRRFKVQELADEFGVSRRTILRDLQALSELGVPLYSEVGPHGGYEVVRERLLPPISFTEGEAVAMFFAVHALRHYAALPFEAESASALKKFYLNAPGDIRDRIDSMMGRVDFITPNRRGNPAYLSLLLDAAIDGRTLSIVYKAKGGKGENRRIKPVSIYAHSGFWYCKAYCYLREGIRVFRCDRIRHATADASAKMEPLDPGEAQFCQRELPDPLDSVPLKAKLSPLGAERIEGEIWFSPLVVVDEAGNGTIDAVVPRSDIPFYADLFIALGNEAELHEPEELREAIRNKLAEMAARYASVNSKPS